MFGAKSRVKLAHRGLDAGDERCSNSGVGPSPSSKTIAPSVPRRLMWMWQELPSRSSNLAMKVSAMPCWAAISLAPFL